MLQNMNYLQVDKPVTVINEYGEDVTTYQYYKHIHILITFLNHSETYTNDVDVEEYSHLGLAVGTVNKGDRIDEQYIVQYVLPSTPFNRVFLQEIK